MEFKGTGKNWHIKGDLKTMEVYSKEYNVPVCMLARQSSFESEVDSQQKANAKLISKAPEMLEMLIRCNNINLIAREHINEDLFKDLENLIKEATEL